MCRGKAEMSADEVRRTGQVLLRQLWLLSTAIPQRQVSYLSALRKQDRLGKIYLKDRTDQPPSLLGVSSLDRVKLAFKEPLGDRIWHSLLRLTMPH